jgi:hypothetical protein
VLRVGVVITCSQAGCDAAVVFADGTLGPSTLEADETAIAAGWVIDKPDQELCPAHGAKGRAA